MEWASTISGNVVQWKETLLWHEEDKVQIPVLPQNGYVDYMRPLISTPQDPIWRIWLIASI